MVKKKMKIKIFSDGADLRSIRYFNKKNFVSGFTTNPSLMAKAKIKNYHEFGKKITKIVKKKHLSFEVISDDYKNILREAKIIAKFGSNAFVKIPIVNSKGKSNIKSIFECSKIGINLNVTAVFTYDQVKSIFKATNKNKSKIIISIFAGRIADTGRDPVNIITQSLKLTRKNKNIEILWASTREVFNIYQANSLGCDIITATPDILSKLNLYNKNLTEYSAETSKSFFKDAQKSNIKIL